MKLDHRTIVATRLVTAACIFICGGLFSTPPSARPRADTKQTPAVAPSETLAVSKITAAEIPMPFRTGETLNYRVEWAIFPNAAALQMNVVERRNLLGWQTWHFRASAHSEVPARTFFEVDDQFDSYTDAATLESHQYEMYLSEMGSKENEVLHLVAIGQPNRGNAIPSAHSTHCARWIGSRRRNFTFRSMTAAIYMTCARARRPRRTRSQWTRGIFKLQKSLYACPNTARKCHTQISSCGLHTTPRAHPCWRWRKCLWEVFV
jgi:hypothetical protein